MNIESFEFLAAEKMKYPAKRTQPIINLDQLEHDIYEYHNEEQNEMQKSKKNVNLCYFSMFSDRSWTFGEGQSHEFRFWRPRGFWGATSIQTASFHHKGAVA